MRKDYFSKFGEHYKTLNLSISVACRLLESAGMSTFLVKFHRTIRFRKPMTGFNSAQKNKFGIFSQEPKLEFGKELTNPLPKLDFFDVF